MSWSSCGGRTLFPVTEASAGDIVAVPKLADVLTGDTLGPKGKPARPGFRPPRAGLPGGGHHTPGRGATRTS